MARSWLGTAMLALALMVELSGGKSAEAMSPAASMHESVAAVPFATPQTGIWWNPAESGSGYTIEVQGNQLSLAMYLYDANGAATWYATILTRQADGSYVGALYRFAGGQSLKGSYRPPTSNTVVASAKLAFDSIATGVLLIEPASGESVRTIPIQRISLTSSGVIPFSSPATNFENGVWWSPSENGRGYFIEVQSTVMSIGSYMYDEAGQPVWYTARALPLNGTRTYHGDLEQFAGGQTLTGAHKEPAPVTSPGWFYFSATSPTTADLSFGFSGLKTIKLHRYVFGTPDAPVPAPGAPTMPDGAFTFVPGDQLTYEHKNSPDRVSIHPAYARTDYVASVSGDGSIKLLSPLSNYRVPEQSELDASFQRVGFTSGTGRVCTHSPATTGPGRNLTVGATWDLSFTRNCADAKGVLSQFRAKSVGRVVARELFNTVAGTFDAHKLSYVFTLDYKDAGLGTTTSTEQTTCWYSAVFERPLACDTSWNQVSERGGQTPTSYISYQLTGLLLANYPVAAPTVQRFSGEWLLSWAGASTGVCTKLYVSLAGIASFAGCDSSQTPFSLPWLLGTVDANGALRAISSSGDVISGTFASTLSASGTWRSTSGMTGTWVASHPDR